MAHRNMVGGTVYDTTGGKTMVGGTVYGIQKGKTMVDGTVREIGFGSKFTINITGTGSTNGAGGTARCYIEVLGTKYATAQSIELDEITEVTLFVMNTYGTSIYSSKITVDGETIFESKESGASKSYKFTPTKPVLNVNMTLKSDIRAILEVTTADK